MKTLAQLTFDYLWLLMFAGEESFDQDYCVKQLEILPNYFAAMTSEEKQALANVAAEAKGRLLAEPDEYGYTPRKLVTSEQIVFLDALISGEIFENF
ncbi:MAG: hypothetical protein P8Y67_12965 [Alphaproteobacteria bacterium]